MTGNLIVADLDIKVEHANLNETFNNIKSNLQNTSKISLKLPNLLTFILKCNFGFLRCFMRIQNFLKFDKNVFQIHRN